MHTPTITIYYDKSCPLCSAEIHGLKNLDSESRMTLVDCSAEDFDDSPFQPDGIKQQDMMNALHIRDEHGAWHKGVDAFEVLYRTAGLPVIGRLWAHPFTRPFTTRLYPWVVRNRYHLSRIGLPVVMELLGKAYAIRAHRNSQRCAKGNCSLPL